MANNLKRLAYDRIRADMLSGKLSAGGTLSAVNMAKELGMSHTPVREAISQLETEGFAVHVPRLGHQIKGIDRNELEDLFELRLFLEQGAAAKAALKISPESIEQLWELCRQYLALARKWRDADSAAVRNETLIKMAGVDGAFHVHLLRSVGNRRLNKLVGDLQLMAFLFRRNVELPIPAAIKRWAAAYREHCLIIRALKRRDPQGAAEAIGRHIEEARSFYLDAYDYNRRFGPRVLADST